MKRHLVLILLFLCVGEWCWGDLIHEMVQAGNADAVKGILSTNAGAVNSLNSRGNSPLYEAASKPDAAMVELLLSARAPVDARNSGGMTALQGAVVEPMTKGLTNVFRDSGLTNLNCFSQMEFDKGARKNPFLSKMTNAASVREIFLKASVASPAKEDETIKVVKMLLAAGAKADKEDNAGCNVLHYASLNSNTNLLLALLQPKVGLEARETQGNTPLLCAGIAGLGGNMQILVSQGADVKAKNRQGLCALFYAVAYDDTNVAKFLLEHNAFVDPVNSYMETPLAVAVRQGFYNMAVLLLDRGAYINVKSGNLSETVLHAAARTGDTALVRMLVDRKATIDARDKEGFTPLLNAAEHGELEMIKLLASKGADVNARLEDGQYAFGLAAGSTNMELLEWLWEKQEKNIPGTLEAINALCNAAMHGRLANVQFILGKGVPANQAYVSARQNRGAYPLHFASGGAGQMEAIVTMEKKRTTETQRVDDEVYARIASLLIEKGASVDALAYEKRTALHWAAAFACEPAAKVLLANKADVRAVTEDGKTPLHLLARAGNGSMADLFLQKGALLESTDKYQFTPLRDAAATGNSSLVKALLEHKANVSVRDRYNATPLHWAAMSTNVAAARLLLDAGADVNAVDMGRRTPLHQAAGKGNVEMVQLLLRYKADATQPDASADTPSEVARKSGFYNVVSVINTALKQKGN